MGRKLILDTGVVVAAERGSIDLSEFADGDDLAIAAVTAAELYAGVLSADEYRRPKREEHFNRLLEIVPVEDYTLQTALVHAELRLHTRRQGRPRGNFDLIIAATAAETGRVVVTTDKAADFGGLPGVNCIELKP